jgi:hypothetical protein
MTNTTMKKLKSERSEGRRNERCAPVESNADISRRENPKQSTTLSQENLNRKRKRRSKIP